MSWINIVHLWHYSHLQIVNANDTTFMLFCTEDFFINDIGDCKPKCSSWIMYSKPVDKAALIIFGTSMVIGIYWQQSWSSLYQLPPLNSCKSTYHYNNKNVASSLGPSWRLSVVYESYTQLSQAIVHDYRSMHNYK